MSREQLSQGLSHMNGLLPFEYAIDQTTRTMPLTPKNNSNCYSRGPVELQAYKSCCSTRKFTFKYRNTRSGKEITDTYTYRLPAKAMPGLIITVSHKGLPAVQHFRTCTLGPKRFHVIK